LTHLLLPLLIYLLFLNSPAAHLIPSRRRAHVQFSDHDLEPTRLQVAAAAIGQLMQPADSIK
jgi:hypothetical protein